MRRSDIPRYLFAILVGFALGILMDYFISGNLDTWDIIQSFINAMLVAVLIGYLNYRHRKKNHN